MNMIRRQRNMHSYILAWFYEVRLVLLLSSIVWSINATALPAITTVDLVGYPELIVHAEVVSQDIRVNEHGVEELSLSLSVIEALKGSANEAQLELVFTGEALEDEDIVDAGSSIPDVGEQGIYFLERPKGSGISSIFGREQGQYAITQDNSIRAPNGELVAEFVATADVNAVPLSDDVALGIRTVKEGFAGAEEAISTEEFKERINQIIEAYSNHATSVLTGHGE